MLHAFATGYRKQHNFPLSRLSTIIAEYASPPQPGTQGMHRIRATVFGAAYFWNVEYLMLTLNVFFSYYFRSIRLPTRK